MKKLLFYLIFMATCGISSAIQVTGFDPFPTDITHDSITMYREVTGNNGFFTEKFIYRKVDDTVFSVGPVHSTNVQNTTFALGGLQADTFYEFAIVVIDGNQTDTTAFFTRKTDTLPGAPGQFILTYAATVVTPVQTKIYFHYSAVYLIGVKVYLNNYSSASSVLVLQGTGDTCISAPVNVSGAWYTNNVLFGYPLAPIAGVNSVQLLVPDYQVPSPTAPDVVSITAQYQSQDSLAFRVRVKPGNLGTTSIVMKWSKSGVVIQTIPSFTTASDTVFTVGKGSLSTNTNYTLTVIATTGGVDSLMLTQATLQVPIPSISGIDTLNATNSFANLVLTGATNGLWYDSYSRMWVVYTNKFGVQKTSDTTDWFLGTYTDTVALVDLKDASAGSNSIVVYIRNIAGLTATLQASVTILGPKPAIPIQWGYLSGGVNKITVNDISMSVPAGDMVDVFAWVQAEGSSVVDTFALYTDFVGTLSGTSTVPIGGLVGNIKYYVRIATRNSDGVVYVNPTTKWEIPIPGINPVQFVAPADVSVNGTAFTFTVRGSGNGTNTNWYGDVYAYGTTTNPVASFAEFVGNTNFAVTKTANGLLPNSHYQFVSRITDASLGVEYGAPIMVDFWTDNTTAIDELSMVPGAIFPDECIVTAYSVTGQQMCEPETYHKLFQQLEPGLIVIVPTTFEDRQKYGIRKVMK